MDITLLKRRSENAKQTEMKEHAENCRGIITIFRVFLHFSLFCVLLLTAQFVQAQSVNKDILPDQLGQKWRATGPARVLEGRRLSGLPDADVSREYGVRRVISRVYTDGGLESSVEVFELNLIPGAYGLFTFNRGQLPQNCSEFLQGRYVVRVLRREAGGDDRQIFEAIKPNLIGGEGELSSLPMHLPETDKIAESEKYIVGPAALARLKNFGDLKDVVSFNAGAEVATADYRSGSGQMNLIIVEYYSPQVARDGEGRIRDHFNALPQGEKDRLIIKRVGNYVVIMSNIQDMPAAQNIVGQIKYQKEIYWAGRKFTDIPLEYRPPDPLAVEEYTRTVKTMIRSFYWTGIVLLSALLLGFTAGFSLFQLKRYRRRKLGLENVFSDAGGSLRLNLDDYLLPDNSSDESTKLTRKAQ
jgi:uncharacterized protein DUF6599